MFSSLEIGTFLRHFVPTCIVKSVQLRGFGCSHFRREVKGEREKKSMFCLVIRLEERG